MTTFQFIFKLEEQQEIFPLLFSLNFSKGLSEFHVELSTAAEYSCKYSFTSQISCHFFYRQLLFLLLHNRDASSHVCILHQFLSLKFFLYSSKMCNERDCMWSRAGRAGGASLYSTVVGERTRPEWGILRHLTTPAKIPVKCCHTRKLLLTIRGIESFTSELYKRFPSHTFFGE